MTTRRAKIVAILVLVGVFVLGTLTGAGSALLIVRHRVRSVLDGPPAELETRGLVFALDRELDLSNAQRAQVEAIHKRYLPELNHVRRKSEPELAVLRARAAADIRALLDPRQQAKFDTMVDLFEGRRKRALGIDPSQPAPTP